MKLVNNLKSKYTFSKNIVLNAQETRHITRAKLVKEINNLSIIRCCVIAENKSEQTFIDKLLNAKPKSAFDSPEVSEIPEPAESAEPAEPSEPADPADPVDPIDPLVYPKQPHNLKID